jgi:lysophospholipase L1-like esterase
MTGDSWAGMHSDFDNFMTTELAKNFVSPVLFESKGKGGEKTKGVYQLMFEDGSYGTKPLLSAGPDYCIISTGINDAAANLGTGQYCHYYLQILDLLLKNHIHPVILEVPNVDLWLMLGEKPMVDLASDYMKAMMTGCGMYNYQEYREALTAMLKSEGLMEHVLFIPMKEWNGDSIDINKSLFLEDRIHLNKKGYESLDSCIAKHIANDYNYR